MSRPSWFIPHPSFLIPHPTREFDASIPPSNSPNRSSPVQIGSDNTWVAVAAGGSHSLGVKANGSLWAWGLNAEGQLGDGTTLDRVSPTQVGAENQWVSYDAGLAAANLTAQATELGLSVHTMAGIIPAALHEVLGLADDTKALVALAVGKLAAADKLEGVLLEREVAARTRLTLDEIVLHGKP